MTPDPEPAHPGGAARAGMSEAEFAQRQKTAPEGFEAWAREVEAAAKNEALPPEVRAAAQHAVAKRHEALCIKNAQARLLALVEVMNRPGG
ncbi:MAG: hypothetical protein NTZ16_12370 [Verrucomicrobia bacterium]|nr:hypothetical protein [Verrucomicrobiota bacterium]